jgi:hypothetical protein
MSVLSRRYVLIRVNARQGHLVIDPTGDDIAFAFTESNVDPEDSDWVNGDWSPNPDDEVIPEQTVFTARCLVGPGGAKALEKGRYWVWLRVTDNPEQPAEHVGTLVIY